jgi:hypothetical protein
MPGDQLDLYLCRDVYHCTPEDLDDQDAERVSRHLVVLDVEAKVWERKHSDASV